MTEPPINIQVTDAAPGTRYIMPSEMFPVHMFHPEFQTLGLWFPALDAWVLEMLCQKAEARRGYGSRFCLNIMEIGSFAGGSASILSPHADQFLCVDTWSGSGKEKDEMGVVYADHPDAFTTFLKNIQSFPRLPDIHRRTLSPDSLPAYLNQYSHYFDLIFIDGGHDYESVMADIEIAKVWIAPGGIICGHDFSEFRGVTEAALDFGLDAACGTVWWKEMP